jgi:predicted acetyltransferase
LATPSDELVGVTRIRHRIDTPFLLEDAGHMGFDVAPSHRRRGFGHFALHVAILEAKNLGIPRALLYASEDNIASRAVIERAGGQLEQVAHSRFWNEKLCKYWLSLETAA